MAKSEREYLLELRGKNICPNCGNKILQGGRVARGAGEFCSLECVAKYNAEELVERARKVAQLAERHRKS